MLKKFIRLGSYFKRISGLIEKEQKSLSLSLSSSAHTEERPHEVIARRWPSASQEGRPYQNLTILAP